MENSRWCLWSKGFVVLQEEVLSTPTTSIEDTILWTSQSVGILLDLGYLNRTAKIDIAERKMSEFGKEEERASVFCESSVTAIELLLTLWSMRRHQVRLQLIHTSTYWRKSWGSRGKGWSLGDGRRTKWSCTVLPRLHDTRYTTDDECLRLYPITIRYYDQGEKEWCLQNDIFLGELKGTGFGIISSSNMRCQLQGSRRRLFWRGHVVHITVTSRAQVNNRFLKKNLLHLEY